MRCHNLGRAAMKGIHKAWDFLTMPRGESAIGCAQDASILSMSAYIIFAIALTTSFYYRNVRRNPTLHSWSELSRFPWEPFTLLLTGYFIWIHNTGLTVLSAFFSSDDRVKMWEGMDLFGDGGSTVFLIFYFIGLEFLEAKVSLGLLKKKYLAHKKTAMLPVIEEKEVLVQLIDEKREVSIYEAIATTPVPSESESESEPLITDAEANITSTPRPTLLQRIKKRFSASPKLDLRTEVVVGRYYMLAFIKSSLIFGFAMVANGLTCTMTPEQYFDTKVSNYMLLLVTLAMWTVRCAWVLAQGSRIAGIEMKERSSIAL